MAAGTGPARHLLAIDQGTTSSRAIVFDLAGRIKGIGQREHRQILPAPGWVEHDPAEIWAATREVISLALARADIGAAAIAGIGITNQRETTMIWDRGTGQPLGPAIVWQDTRTQPIAQELAADGGEARFHARTGLLPTPYFSATKLMWLLDHVPGARTRAEAGELAFGTMDSWIAWNLTGGPAGGRHVTDVTNASRTLLMDLRSLTWDEQILSELAIPASLLPQIRSSSEVMGVAASSSPLAGVPLAGILGDQQAAAFGQAAFNPGDAKNTYGTGCFLLLNTGNSPVLSRNGLLTTVAYQLAGSPASYAIEGSVAVAGSLVQWLRDNLGLIGQAAEIEPLAASVPDCGGAYFVPAFSGLFAPYWRPDARGALVGLTRFINKGHLARAVLEATAFQSAEVLDAANQDTQVPLTELRVDGGMVRNELLMQFQADILQLPVVRPAMTETTALGAAYAAGLATGCYDGFEELKANWRADARWVPTMAPAERDRRYRQWKKAVTKAMGWED